MRRTRKLIHDIMFVEKETSESLTDKVHIILCSLQEVPERWEDCRTEIEEKLAAARRMKAGGLSLNMIAAFTQLTEAEIQSL